MEIGIAIVTVVTGARADTMKEESHAGMMIEIAGEIPGVATEEVVTIAGSSMVEAEDVVVDMEAVGEAVGVGVAVVGLVDPLVLHSNGQ